MGTFQLRLDNNDILLYRCIYAPVKSNMYIIISNNEAIVIDANDNEDGIKLLKNKKIENIHLVLTHEHYDHTLGVNLYRKEFPVTDLFCQEETARYVEVEKKNNPMMIAFVLANKDREDGGTRYKEFKEKFRPYTLCVDDWFDEECKRTIAGIPFRFVHTPGHSSGSCCIEMGKYVFTGDSLLRDDAIILRFPESEKNIYKEITLPYLKGLNMDTTILPGHGDPFKIGESKYL
jgi:hydroxyacylglutathione hydrolase